MINILFIHQSSEMYGSDKTLLLLLKNLDKSRFNAVVVLPSDGLLKVALEEENIKVVIAPVLKLYRKMFSPKNIINFISDKKKGIELLDELNRHYKFALIYSNTLAVLLGLFYAKKRKIKHLWHVHEIIESPRIFSKAFTYLLDSGSNSKIIYNSIATKNFWNTKKSIAIKSEVVWNGMEVLENNITEAEIATIRADYFDANSNDIVIALIGRISRWKGQMILLNSFKKLSATTNNIKLVFVGSPPPNQENFQETLEHKILEYGLTDKVKLIPFQHDIYKFWQSIDIAVVPSTEPEPFGLVVIEAMLAKKPVIASNHGGPTEIVLDQETGYLFEPNNEESLANKLELLILDESKRKTFGNNGYVRAVNVFSLGNHVKHFEKIFEENI